MRPWWRTVAGWLIAGGVVLLGVSLVVTADAVDRSLAWLVGLWVALVCGFAFALGVLVGAKL
jgi:Flp pilus assembly protein protease CpaA